MIYFLAILLLLSLAYNFYVLLELRRHRASLKYMKHEFNRFTEDAEERIKRHESLIRDTRQELKDFDVDDVTNVGVLSKPETREQ